MEIQEFINCFAAQFDDTDADIFKAETKFREIEEWSSLTMLGIIAMVDDEYKVKIKGEEIRNAQSIEDLYNIVKSRV
jgi:acyl carrier protein